MKQIQNTKPQTKRTPIYTSLYRIWLRFSHYHEQNIEEQIRSEGKLRTHHHSLVVINRQKAVPPILQWYLHRIPTDLPGITTFSIYCIRQQSKLWGFYPYLRPEELRAVWKEQRSSGIVSWPTRVLFSCSPKIVICLFILPNRVELRLASSISNGLSQYTATRPGKLRSLALHTLLNQI